MKKIITIIKTFASNKELIKKTVEGVKKVREIKMDKKKITLLIIAILAILTLFGVISEDTFIHLFKEVN